MPPSMHTLLLVDDSPTQARYLTLLIESLGWCVHACSSAELSPETLTGLSIDLALVSLLTESSNGFELGMQLQTHGVKRVAIVTKDPRKSDIQWAISLGLQGALDAPSTKAHIEQQLEILQKA